MGDVRAPQQQQRLTRSCPLVVSAVYDVTLNFRANKNPSLLGILYGKKYEADMCVR